MKLHKHHIIPNHAGGTDDESNIVELTIEEHARAHELLYEKYGRIQDKVAYMGLLKLAPNAEIMYTLRSESMKGENNPMYGKPAPNRGIKRPGIGGRKKGTTWSEQERESKMKLHTSVEHREKMAKIYADENRNKKIAESRRGKPGHIKGKVWYNNGIIEKYFVLDQQPKDWLRGRINKK